MGPGLPPTKLYQLQTCASWAHCALPIQSAHVVQLSPSQDSQTPLLLQLEMLVLTAVVERRNGVKVSSPGRRSGSSSGWRRLLEGGGLVWDERPAQMQKSTKP